MKKIIWVLLLLIIGVNLFANSGYRLNSNSTPISKFSIPLDVSYNTDYSYGLLGNETKKVWVDDGPSGGKVSLLISGGILCFSEFILLTTAWAFNVGGDDIPKGLWVAVGVTGGLGLTLLTVGLCLPNDGYYKTVEVVNNDDFKSEIYLASNIATTSVGYKMSFK